ncbi:hypothetical protein [Methylomonas koyamae]|uniref:hypothetical protein n=1 Tax=Methylomonas koyamae TaxID=702114 RepID=UPI001C3245B8|nr:hypothetical protein [Methylomonas koyamae]BBL60243.1 hypothetical protein MKFW12EY_38560 [Methylomonas koyamae]
MALPTIEPIQDGDLLPFCQFLTEHLSNQRSAEQWAQAFRQNWISDKPNNGFVIRDSGKIVGGIGAIYAERKIRGQTERFCNITSWCVLEAYRAQSMRLAMAVVSQPGFHFTDLTPTEVVSKTLQFLKFKPMNERHAIWPNFPWPFSAIAGVKVITDHETIASVLPADAGKVFTEHRHLSWLQHAAVGKPGAYCHVVWKPNRLKGVNGAMILGFSDAELFLRYRHTFGSHLFWQGRFYTRVESRLLPTVPTLALELAGYRNKVFRSDTLTAADISNFYSELMALDL